MRRVLAVLSVLIGTLTMSLVTIPPAVAGATSPTTTVYDSTDPGSRALVSQPFQAQQATEVGNEIVLAPGTSRSLNNVVVSMESYGCQSGDWSTGNCSTSPGATFAQPITLNLYAANPDNTTGALITSVTQTVNLAYRPSADPTNCPATPGQWFDAGGWGCVNSIKTDASLNLGNVTVPNKVIYGVEIRTTSYGDPAIGGPMGTSTACFSTSAGCPYDSLNVGLSLDPTNVTVGSNALTNGIFWATTTAGWYCDGGAGGVGTFRFDGGCWDDGAGSYYVPAVQFNASQTAITSADNATFTTGSAGSFTVTATGAPAPTFSETGTLPTGVSFNSTTGVLSGTPTASGSFSITMGATNGVGSDATQPFTLTVNAAPTITSGASKVFVKGVAGSFTVTATGYPAPTFSETGTLPTGITLNSSGVLSGTSTQTGSFPVTMTATNGVGTDATQNFTVNVVAAPVFTSANNATFTTAGSNSFTVSASGFPAPTFAVTTGTLPSGVTLNSTTGVLSGTPAATGVTSVTITATNAVSNATQSFTLTANAGPVITSANSTGFVATVAGTFTVTASGYPAPTFTETGALPAGITLNATTGVLSGTTTAAGTYVIALKATNGVGSGGTQVFTLTVATAVPTFTSASSGTAVAGTPYSFTIRAIGASPITMSTASTSAITAAGLTFTDNGDGTATVAGTPLASAAGLKTWTWKAQNAAGKTLQGFNLAINLAPSITSAASKSVKTGVAFSMTITSKGFPVATLSATGLPAGVTLVNIGSGKGTLAGTMPAGVHTFTITASNGVLPNATQTFTLTGK